MSTATHEVEVASAITTALTDWQESPMAWTDLVKAGRELLHRGFAVGSPSSTGLEGPAGRGRSNTEHPMLLRSRIVVRWAWRLQADGSKAAYRLALADEVTLIKAVLTASLTDADIRFVGSSRRAVGDEWLLVDTAFDLHHNQDLS